MQENVSNLPKTLASSICFGLSLFTVATFIANAKAHAQLAGGLTVEVDNIRNQEGQVCFNLFDSSNGFPSDKAKATKTDCVEIGETPLEIKFNNLPFGNYAISLYHDSNGDRTLNRAAFGMPSEGYGFSNNPKVLTGPASFGESMFLLAGKNTNIKIKLTYPN